MLRAVMALLLMLILGAMIITPFGPARVISGSMEPEILTGSTIMLIPSREIVRGDIIVFHPHELGREMIVHRVVDILPEGFITQGDASFYTDQEQGEPPVTIESVEGKVLVIGGEVPQIDYNTFIYFIAALCALLGIIWAASGMRLSKRRLRVKHIQSFVIVLCVVLLFFTTVMGSGAQTVNYLSSMNPGTRTDHVKVGEPGEIEFTGTNRSLIPTLVYVEGPVNQTAQLVLPFADFETAVEVPARNETGWFEISVQQFVYPVAMPPFIIDLLYRVSPYLAMIVVLSFIIAIIHIILRILEPWMPLSLMGGKRLSRSYRRLKRSLIS